MRFARNATVFKGSIDAAPLASVVFLLLIFVVLHSALVFAPGIKVELADFQKIAGTNQFKIVTVQADGQVEYNKQVYPEKKFLEKLALDEKKNLIPPVLIVKEEPGAPTAVFERLRAAVADYGTRLEKPGLGLDLPEGDGEPGLAEGAIYVAIDRTGDFFYENQIVSEADLQTKLSQLAKKESRPLTLVFEADRNIEYQTVVRLSQIAKKAGLKQVLWATRPPLKPAWPAKK